MPITLSGDIKTAVSIASKMAKKEAGAKNSFPVVLLSPAASSFDQFKNFEVRGDVFRDLVEAIPGKQTDPFEKPWIFSETSNPVTFFSKTKFFPSGNFIVGI